MGCPKSPGESRKLERHCSSGPIKLGIFDIYRSTLTQSNCLGLSSSILNGILTKKNYMYIFWIHRFCILFLSRRFEVSFYASKKNYYFFKLLGFLKSKGWRFDFRGLTLF